jgi:hypothetical protein
LNSHVFPIHAVTACIADYKKPTGCINNAGNHDEYPGGVNGGADEFHQVTEGRHVGRIPIGRLFESVRKSRCLFDPINAWVVLRGGRVALSPFCDKA